MLNCNSSTLCYFDVCSTWNFHEFCSFLGGTNSVVTQKNSSLNDSTTHLKLTILPIPLTTHEKKLIKEQERFQRELEISRLQIQQQRSKLMEAVINGDHDIYKRRKLRGDEASQNNFDHFISLLQIIGGLFRAMAQMKVCNFLDTHQNIY